MPSTSVQEDMDRAAGGLLAEALVALKPLECLHLPWKMQGNAGAYSIRYSDIAAAKSISAKIRVVLRGESLRQMESTASDLLQALKGLKLNQCPESWAAADAAIAKAEGRA